MKTATIEEVVRRPEEALAGDEQVVLIRNGRPIGVFQPLPEPDASLSMKVRRMLYGKTGKKIGRKLDALGITEEKLQRDFEALRKNRRRR